MRRLYASPSPSDQRSRYRSLWRWQWLLGTALQCPVAASCCQDNCDGSMACWGWVARHGDGLTVMENDMPLDRVMWEVSEPVRLRVACDA